MQQAARDYWLAEQAPEIMDTVAGNAMATISVLKAPTRHRDAKRVEVAKEIASRFQTQTVTLQTFLFDFSPDMPDADLRKWAADLKAAISG